MKLLVVHFEVNKSDRNTINEHLYSFRKYSSHEVIYLNAFYGVPPYIHHMGFDAVLFHYTFLSQKWNGRSYFRRFLARCERLKKIRALKIAMPQDEYVNSELLCEFFREFEVEVLFTCFEECEWNKVYPQKSTGLVKYFTTLTGYIDEHSLNKIQQYCKPHQERVLDIGYRARKLPFWLGEHGTIKWKITELFERALIGSSLKNDLSNDDGKVFLGDSWYKFLGNCRVVLGCEGGASLHDPDGSIRARVDEYVEQHPDVSFEMVKELFFPDKDYNINLFAISPRHFEACMTKTTQVLVEGRYFGIFESNVHYIELKRDWSNLSDVLKLIADKEYCEQIAERAFQDIIGAGKYTYRYFVSDFFEKIKPLIAETSHNNIPKQKLAKFLFVVYPRIFHFFIFSNYRFRVVGFKLLRIFGLVSVYRRARAKFLGWEP